MLSCWLKSVLLRLCLCHNCIIQMFPGASARESRIESFGLGPLAPGYGLASVSLQRVDLDEKSDINGHSLPSSLERLSVNDAAKSSEQHESGILGFRMNMAVHDIVFHVLPFQRHFDEFFDVFYASMTMDYRSKSEFAQKSPQPTNYQNTTLPDSGSVPRPGHATQTKRPSTTLPPIPIPATLPTLPPFVAKSTVASFPLSTKTIQKVIQNGTTRNYSKIRQRISSTPKPQKTTISFATTTRVATLEPRRYLEVTSPITTTVATSHFKDSLFRYLFGTEDTTKILGYYSKPLLPASFGKKNQTYSPKLLSPSILNIQREQQLDGSSSNAALLSPSLFSLYNRSDSLLPLPQLLHSDPEAYETIRQAVERFASESVAVALKPNKENNNYLDAVGIRKTTNVDRHRQAGQEALPQVNGPYDNEYSSVLQADDHKQELNWLRFVPRNITSGEIDQISEFQKQWSEDTQLRNEWLEWYKQNNVIPEDKFDEYTTFNSTISAGTNKPVGAETAKPSEIKATLQKAFILQPFILAPDNASGPFILSPLIVSPLILSPYIFGPYILSPLIASPAVLSPGALSPAIASPIIASPLLLSPQVLSPLIASPQFLSPSILSPGVLNPAILSPGALNPCILSPNALSPSILSPALLSPDILCPSILSGRVYSPTLLSGEEQPENETLVTSPERTITTTTVTSSSSFSSSTTTSSTTTSQRGGSVEPTREPILLNLTALHRDVGAGVRPFRIAYAEAY